MSAFIDTLRQHATIRPHACAVSDGASTWSYARLIREIDMLASRLEARSVGLLLDNGPAWVVADFATLTAGATCVPLPPYFSVQQLRHTIKDAGVDLVLTDDPERLEAMVRVEVVRSVTVCGHPVALCRLRTERRAAPDGAAAKISYTSGTTGAPRGVCLSNRVMERKAEALVEVVTARPDETTLCLAPLAILLENIGSVYVPLLVGAQCCVPPLSAVGMTGSSGLDAGRMVDAIRSHRPTSFITTPQVLNVLVEAAERGTVLSDRLRFIAVGGAPVAPALLDRATDAGLPVYQGYGLTEAASVVALNGPGANRPGSVGRALPGLDITIADDGEICVTGAMFDGYLGEAPVRDTVLYTGDLGAMDDDGYLYVTGRKKHMFTTAFGRNVSPEWVEGELCEQQCVAQAVVAGEGHPSAFAVIVPAPAATARDIARAVAVVNDRLPDYARIGGYILAREPFTPANGQLTATGRPRRDVIHAQYAEALAPARIKRSDMGAV